MGLLDSLLSASGIGRAFLSDAVKDAPNSMGVYQVKLKGKLMYVGKAEDGLRKRFVQYYNGTAGGYNSADNIYRHRDEVVVEWRVVRTREECRYHEKILIQKKNPPWNEKSGWERY